MKNIQNVKIFPPMVIARFGSSEQTLEAYTIEINEKNPLDFRNIIGTDNIIIDENANVKIENPRKNEQIKFSYKDDQGVQKIRPIAPFLELWVQYEGESNYVPLKNEDNIIENIAFKVELQNHKIFRRTTDDKDIITGIVAINPDNKNKFSKQSVIGQCPNFLEGKSIPLGSIQMLKASNTSNDETSNIRFRFTPPHGKVYGPDKEYIKTQVEHNADLDNEYKTYLTNLPEEDNIYDSKKGKWTGYEEGGMATGTTTNPAQIFAGYDDGDNRISVGLFDDAADGFLEVSLNINNQEFKAKASIVNAPPAFAPDLVPVRVVTDELEQIFNGPDLKENEEVYIDDIQNILRKAFETIRLMNTAIMNGNPYYGVIGSASSMPRQDTNDTKRAFEPIMQAETVDNYAIRTLHEKIYNSLESGIAPWFINSIRMPYEVGQMDNQTRRKMPAMMRGADARALTLTYRNINQIIKATLQGALKKRIISENKLPTSIPAKDLVGQLNYRGLGNPFGVLPAVAISNCFPGLEYDFKNLWTRTFEGIELSENNNFVMSTDSSLKDLLHQRLIVIDGKATTVASYGPIMPNKTPDDNIDLSTPAFMEWSNSLVYTLQKQGETIPCYFTQNADGQAKEIVIPDKDLEYIKTHSPNNHTTENGIKLIRKDLTIRHFFENNTLEFNPELVKAGDLTRGLCAPWQNDFKECACYYWAASRPDYVNIIEKDGYTTGDNWMSKERTGQYIPDTRVDTHFLSYTDLFSSWEKELKFIIGGKDEQ